MNEHSKLWVAALRSGNYEQGFNFLHYGKAYCSLGVACETYMMVTGLPLETETSQEGITFYEGNQHRLPSMVQGWLGLTTSTGIYGHNSGYTLTYDNDIRRLSFQKIADIIESEPEGLFTSN